MGGWSRWRPRFLRVVLPSRPRSRQRIVVRGFGRMRGLPVEPSWFLSVVPGFADSGSVFVALDWGSDGLAVGFVGPAFGVSAVAGEAGAHDSPACRVACDATDYGVTQYASYWAWVRPAALTTAAGL